MPQKDVFKYKIGTRRESQTTWDWVSSVNGFGLSS